MFIALPSRAGFPRRSRIFEVELLAWRCFARMRAAAQKHDLSSSCTILRDCMGSKMKIQKNNAFARLRERLVAFHEDTSAATATEYIILLILIACFVIAIVKLFGTTVSKKFEAADQVVVKEVTY
jgi:Flp pilus assembly pilin Flp